jgi:hypothetical protein
MAGTIGDGVIFGGRTRPEFVEEFGLGNIREVSAVTLTLWRGRAAAARQDRALGLRPTVPSTVRPSSSVS